jgi:hypothetical protein
MEVEWEDEEMEWQRDSPSTPENEEQDLDSSDAESTALKPHRKRTTNET